jgi:hypothetical protein
VKSAQHPGLRIFGTDFDRLPHEQLGLAHQALNALLQFGIPFPVLEAFVGQDAFDRLLLGDRDVLADVFLRPLVHQEVTHQAFIRGIRTSSSSRPMLASAGWIRFSAFHGTG